MIREGAEYVYRYIYQHCTVSKKLQPHQNIWYMGGHNKWWSRSYIWTAGEAVSVYSYYGMVHITVLGAWSYSFYSMVNCATRCLELHLLVLRLAVPRRHLNKQNLNCAIDLR